MENVRATVARALRALAGKLAAWADRLAPPPAPRGGGGGDPVEPE